MLERAQAPLSAILPNTDYFEVDSKIAGARYAVWVSTPARYEKEAPRLYPAIFLPDGNLAAPVTVPWSVLVRDDPINPVQPVIEVSVGYAGADADDALRIRNRDLLPPGEPPHPSHLVAFDQGAASGVWDKDWVEGYKKLMHNGRADLFLAFLTDELFAEVASRYRVDQGNSGLFGYSYGGLFALYAAFHRTKHFKRIGAGSPGMMTDKSVIFDQLHKARAARDDHAGRHLHLTLCEREMTVPSSYQLLADQFGRLTTSLGREPIPGLTLTSKIIPEESHATGFVPSWHSYLRACYGA